MKLIPLLLIYTITLSAQEYDCFYYEQLKEAKASRNEGWKTLAVYGSSIILNGIGDGLNDSGKKTTGHLFNAASIGVLLGSPFILEYKDKWYKYVISYTTLRVGFFDYSYNTTRGLPLNYIGTTSITDKAYRKFGGPGFIRPANMIFGIGFTLKIK